MPLYLPAGTGSGNGTPGAPGASVYDIWLAQGNTGSQAVFLAAQKGAKGDTGLQGIPGTPGAASTVAGPEGRTAAVVKVQQSDGTYVLLPQQFVFFVGATPPDPATTTDPGLFVNGSVS